MAGAWKTLVGMGAMLLVAVTVPSGALAGSGGQSVGSNLGEFLASPFVAAFDPAPVEPRLRFDSATSAPVPPPGLCRWERTVLDGFGRPILDRYGRPVKEYAIGSCVAPPPY